MNEFERDVIDRLGRIETHAENTVKKVGDHEDRLRTQEKRSWIVIGLSLAISTVAPGLAGKLGF